MHITELLQRDMMIVHQFQQKKIINRTCYTSIPIDQQCIGLLGLRGVGKTSYLLSQRITKKHSIYISCDSVGMKVQDLFQIIQELYKSYDITTFFLDEVQYLNDRDGYIKNIIDILPVHIVFSGSNMIDITRGGHDLSRRALIYRIPQFSFAEYILLKKGIAVPTYSLDTLIQHHTTIATQHSLRYTPTLFAEYLHYGQFGYRYADQQTDIYITRLDNSIQKVIYEDICNIVAIGTENLSKITDLLIYLCQGAGTSTVTIASLSAKLSLTHKTTEIYVEFLEKAGLLYRIYPAGTLTNTLRKMKKLYPSSTNILSLFGSDIGYMRESFFVDAVHRILPNAKHRGSLQYMDMTDFQVSIADATYFFEIGGKGKSRSEKNLYVVKDDITIGQENSIPLWLFGLLG